MYLTYVVKYWHCHIALLLVLFRRRNIFAIFGEVASRTKSLGFLLLALLLRCPRSPFSLLADLRGFQSTAST
jgi:hypothetical protein